MGNGPGVGSLRLGDTRSLLRDFPVDPGVRPLKEEGLCHVGPFTPGSEEVTR